MWELNQWKTRQFDIATIFPRPWNFIFMIIWWYLANSSRIYSASLNFNGRHLVFSPSRKHNVLEASIETQRIFTTSRHFHDFYTYIMKDYWLVKWTMIIEWGEMAIVFSLFRHVQSPFQQNVWPTFWNLYQIFVFNIDIKRLIM